jgi:hypothetical protein
MSFFDFIGKMIAGISRSVLLRWSENSTLLIAHHMSKPIEQKREKQ